MTKGTHQEERFIQRVSDSATQLLLMRPWSYDVRLEARGWKTFYAVDADIVRMYGSPGHVARRRGGRLGYAEVFEDDPEPGSHALAERLSDHIFFELTANAPLIVVPPIDGEIRSMLEAVAVRVGKAPRRRPIDHERLTQFTEELKGAIGGEVPVDVLEGVLELVALRRGGAANECRRLSDILRLRRIVPAHSLDQSTDHLPDYLIDAVKEFGELSDMFGHVGRSQEWLSRIKSTVKHTKISHHKHVRLVWDSQAMARIELWNDRLREHNSRVVYITGSMHLVMAALSYTADGRNRNFFVECVRHPRYFLASPNVVVAPRGGGREHSAEGCSPGPGASRSQFAEWIETFIVDCRVDTTDRNMDTDSFHLVPDSVEAARKAFRSNPDLDEELRQNWREYLSTLSASYMPPDAILDGIQEDLLQSSEKRSFQGWRDVHGMLEGQIEEEKDRAWEACFESAAKTGFFFQSQSSHFGDDYPPRLVPMLVFDRQPETDEFVRSMSRWRTAEDMLVKAYDEGVRRVREETGADFSYVYYLAHAALFAARGNWRIGAVLSMRAMEKAHDPSVADPGIFGHGREAGYLAAYCLRHQARTPDDLDEAERYVERAIAIHREESTLHPDLVTAPRRFDAEKLALRMTRMCFRKYAHRIEGVQPPRLQPPPSREEWLDIRRRYEELRCDVDGGSGSDKVMKRREWLLSWIDGNLCTASFMAGECEGDAFEAAGRRLHDFLERNPEHESYYLHSLDLLWMAATNAPSVSRRMLRDHFSSDRISRFLVLRYDKPRYEDMADTAEKLLRGSERSRLRSR